MTVATDSDGANGHIKHLVDVVEQVTALPFGWAVLGSIALAVCFMLFAFALIVLVVMVKTCELASGLVARRTPTAATIHGGG